MPLFNKIVCDCGCCGELDLGGPEDTNVKGADEILQITDANSQKFWFLNANCLRTWAAKYESPYKRPEPAQFIPMDAILPGEKAN
jgi:hypothetical protein